ncbi:hypothetical protein POTOM_028229 [Populus tomentosa]|uniref:peroxidase n=1 Tax=Populus tomentosa TaxID=118781 RepID=A0A8X7ZPS1_POPTO|nr:hypothetical protein POTOM_028229 [Populus tomentosa]
MAASRFHLLLVLSLTLSLCLFPDTTWAQLRQNYYASSCPRVESIVRGVVQNKIKQTFVTIPATLRLFFHDCFVQGCDASVIVASTATNKAEKDHSDNLSLAGDGFDTVIKAKAAVDATPGCKNKVSCADILAIATRDVIALSGGPSYPVELGRLDGLSSTAASVNRKLPQPTFSLNQLTAMFAANGLSQTDMIALSGMTIIIVIVLNSRAPITDILSRSKPTVTKWATDSQAFQQAFITAMTKLGRVGVKSGRNGNIRQDCAVLA